MNFNVDSDETSKKRIWLNAKPIGYWAIRKTFFFRKLRLQNFFLKKLLFEPNIIPHSYDMGPMLWNWDKAYSKILDTPLMSDVNIVWNVHFYNWIILLFYRFELLSSNIVFVLEERKTQSSLESKVEFTFNALSKGELTLIHQSKKNLIH